MDVVVVVQYLVVAPFTGGGCPRHALLVPSLHSHPTQLHISVHVAVGQGACLPTPHRCQGNLHMIPGTQHQLSHP